MRRSMVAIGIALWAAAVLAAPPAGEEGPPTTPQAVRDLAAAGKSFRGAMLAGMDLAGLRCANLDLSATNWSGADLRGAVFTQVNLTGASFDGANARGLTLVDCNLTSATLRKADLSGALLRGVQLGGADLSAARLRGAELDGGIYSRTGARHTSALALALSTARPAPQEGAPALPTSATFAAGLSGDPFCFVYNSADPTQWPMTPFTESPLRAAARAVGIQVEVVSDLPPQKALDLLVRVLQGGKLCLLPISLAGEGVFGKDLEQPFWALTRALDSAENPSRVSLVVPPFGEREYGLTDLASRWQGPWPTLEPAATERAEANFPLVVVPRAETIPAPREVVRSALAHAQAIMLEERTYATLVPGVAGLRRLAEDLARAASATELPSVAKLAAWDDGPRPLLISARKEAADFLELAANLLTQAERPAVEHAAALLRAEAQILTEQFPRLKPGPADTLDQVQARYARASRAVSELAGIEARVAELLAEVAPAPPKQPKPQVP